MRLIDQFADLALRHLGGSDHAALLELFRDPPCESGKRVLAALHLACRRAWLALELALGGASLGGPLEAFFSGGGRSHIAREIQVFLQAFPMPELTNKSYFRQQCLEELRWARREGLLTAERLTSAEWQRKGEDWLTEERPPRALQVELRVQDNIAAELEEDGLQSLPWLLRQRPQGRTPLLLTAVRYFFRAQVEEAGVLGGQALFPLDEDLDGEQAEGLRLLHVVFRLDAPRVEAFLDARRTALLRAAPPTSSGGPGAGTASSSEREELLEVVDDSTEGGASSSEAELDAYAAALEEGRYDDALEHLRQALQEGSEGLAPFPVEDYEPLQVLRGDRFSVTYLCRAKALGGQVAVESLTLRPVDLRVIAAAFRDAIILHQLHHPSIMRLHRWGYVDAEKTRPYIVMEPFTGATLQEHIEENGPLGFAEIKELVRLLAEALRSAHRRGIVHRGLEPANVLLRRPDREDGGLWEVRIIHFALPLALAEVEAGTAPAAPLLYAAPEQLGKLPGTEVGPATDVYSLGRLCCYALFQSADPSPEDWQRASPSLANLIQDCIAEAPEARLPDCDAVLERLARVQAGRPFVRASGAVASPPRLIVLRGLKLHVEYVLHEGTNLIGRDAGASTLDVDLEDQEPDGSVLSSRRHALITWKEGRLSVTDLHSANGTYVNRVRVVPGDDCPLEDLDQLQVGSVVLQVVHDGGPTGS
jgi:serine/threonine protein kinase